LFLKQKSKIFPNVLFLYYVTNKSEFGKNSLLPKTALNYPCINHIYDIYELIVSVEGVESTQDIQDGFTEMESDYVYHRDNVYGKQQSNKKSKVKVHVKQENENELDDDIIYDEHNNSTHSSQSNQHDKHQIQHSIQSAQSTQLPQQMSPEKFMQMMQSQAKTQMDNYKKNVDDKKRLIDKLTFIKNKSDEYTLDFAKDIAKRKKDEEKQKKKNKKTDS
jgi:hypothetical protein